MNVAVDGGQSGLRLRLLPEGPEGRGPGYAHSADGVTATIESVRQAARDAGLPQERVDTVCLGLSGYPRTHEGVMTLAKGVATVLGAARVLVSEDMVTAHAGALPGGHGVVMAAGTGAVCLAVSGGGYRKVDGGGYLLGDAGSGFAIGRAGLAAVQRHRDGRGPATALSDAAPADLMRLYDCPSLVEDVAAFARTVLAHARRDAVAARIVARAAADLAETITTAVAATDGDQVPVACVGGLFNAGEQLLAPIRSLLPGQARLQPPAGTPLDGAARLATGPLGPYEPLVVEWRVDQ